MRFRPIAYALAALVLWSPAAEAEPVGTATRLSGQAWADTHPLTAGSTIDTGSELATGPASLLEVSFVDGSRLTLGEHARMTVDSFVYDPGNSRGNALLRLREGAFLMVTGGIGKLPERPLKVATPVATIGIRGTTFWGGSLENPLDVLVLDGAVIVTSGGGRVEVDAGQGTGVPSADTAPTPAMPWRPAKVQRALDSVAWR